MFDEMAAEEDTHRQRLIELHRSRFGEVIPLIRREHVAGTTRAVAEEVGFEPTVRFHARRFSRPVHSTTLPLLRVRRT
jgi:hypothetical protein